MAVVEQSGVPAVTKLGAGSVGRQHGRQGDPRFGTVWASTLWAIGHHGHLNRGRQR